VNKDTDDRLYRNLFEHANDGIALLKVVGDEIRYIECNARQAAILGRRRKEILERSPVDFSPVLQPDGRPSANKAMEIIRASLTGQPQSFIWRHHRKNGETLDLDISLNSVGVEGEQLVLAITRDVTEREQTANALRESTIKLNAILDHHYQLTGLLDPEGRLLAANKTALELVGVDEAEVIGRYFWDTPWWSPSQEPELRSAIKRAAKGEFVRFETTHPVPSGELRDIDFSVNPVRDENGSVVYLVPQGLDITEQQQAKTERERLITDLEAQNTELERFAYTVSHDLQTPLTTITNFSGALRHDLRQGNMKRVEEDAERIEAAGTEMGELLNSVLELSRVGRVVGPTEDVPMAELVRETLALSDISRGGVNVVIADDLPTLHGDRMRLREVLQNLIENAIKYMGDQPKPRVEIGARQDGSETTYYVRDNGIGIMPPYQERIFDLFDQLNQNIDGSGIGLALAKRIVEVHGGRIWCESEGTGHGSTFCFTIPPRPTSSEF
jgi:PAS domain S-box-containing protein